MTWVCREEVAACPIYIHKRLAPLMQLVKADNPHRRQRQQQDSVHPQSQRAW